MQRLLQNILHELSVAIVLHQGKKLFFYIPELIPVGDCNDRCDALYTIVYTPVKNKLHCICVSSLLLWCCLAAQRIFLAKNFFSPNANCDRRLKRLSGMAVKHMRLDSTPGPYTLQHAPDSATEDGGC